MAARMVLRVSGSAPAGSPFGAMVRRTGEASTARSRKSVDELTPQELQIARLAANGLTNRDIGEQLYLSHRTVGFHLYHVYPKLGISGRAQLHAALGAA